MPELASSAQTPDGGAVDHANADGAPAVSPPCVLVTTVRQDGDRVRVEVSGELDLDAGERFRSVLRDALSRSVRGIDLDLKGVSFCDCSALNVLLHLRHRALEQSKTVAIHSTSTVVDRLLTLTVTHALFGHRDPDAAAAAARHTGDAGHFAERNDPEALDETHHDLRIEVAQLRRAMQTRPTIDLARGILMASFSLSSEEAWTVLVTASQNTNTKLHSLAGNLVTAVKGDALSDELQEHLSAAVARISSAAPEY